MKLVETSLIIDIGDGWLDGPEWLMCTLQRAASHDGGDTS
jgi:hypothetical protein